MRRAACTATGSKTRTASISEQASVMDLVFRNARLADARPADPLVDIAVEGGRIAAIGPKLDVQGPERDLAGGAHLRPYRTRNRP